MGLINPLYALTIPSLVLITIPLAILATITTTLAFSVLFLRALAVYLDLVLSFVPQSLTGPSSSSSSSSSPSPAQQQQQQALRARTLKLAQSPPPAPPLVLSSPHSSTRSLHHPRRRRRSSASVVSAPISERGLGLIPSVGAERDFEGIGGWRRVNGQGGPSDDEDDLAWTTVNPPLQLQLPRHHARSASGPSGGLPGGGGGGGGVTTPGDGGTYLMMRSGRTMSPETRNSKRTSPNSSRARTPTGPRHGGFFPFGAGQPDGYFALSHGSGAAQSVAASPKSMRKGAGYAGEQN